LGLAISRSIVEQHGGRIRAESRGKDLGCRFVVELPTTAQPLSAGSAPSAPAGWDRA
jgi:signal transduction histidine kinase